MEDQLPTESDSIELEPDLAPGMEPEEGAPTRRTIKRTAVQQGSMIPTGWKPTAAKPIPVVRCNYVWKDGHARQGERCEQWSLRGSQLCWAHSGRGNLKNVETYRQAIVEAARIKLTEYAPAAVLGLIDLAENSTADNVRLKAYESVLDRTGIKTAEQLNVDLTVSEANPAVALAERLQKLKTAADIVRAKEEEADAAAEAAASASLLELEAGDGVIVDAEIVDETDD